MHLLVTDHITCPGCGPTAGLILLAEQMDSRRILQGWLGCPACRQQYRVRAGLAELGAVESAAAAGLPPEAVQVAALLGVTDGSGMLLLVGDMAEAAEAVAELLQGVEVIVATPYANERAEYPGVSRLQVGAALPLRDRSMRGVAVSGSGVALLAEAARVCALAGRVAVFGAGPRTREILTAAGLHVVAVEGETMLAVRHA